MKPSIQDIQIEKNKANFVSWLLIKFGEKEFTNSEMKKVYNEKVTNTIENASGRMILKELKYLLNDPISDWFFSAPIKNYSLYQDKKVVHVVFDTESKSVMDIPYYALARYINPRLNFPKSYTLNSTFNGCNFYSIRKEEVSLTVKKATGIKGIFLDIPIYRTVREWESEEELKGYFMDGKYCIEEKEISTFKYYFRLNGTKAANYIMNQAKTAQNLREERTKSLVAEMPEDDRQEILEYLADHYGYSLE